MKSTLRLPGINAGGLPSARAQAEGSGLILSGDLYVVQKGQALRRRMDQEVVRSSRTTVG